MISSPLLVGGDLAMPKDGRAIGDAVRSVLLPIWNAYSFFTLYANIDGIKGKLVTTAEAELDRYILGKTAELVRGVEAAMDRLDIAAACNALPPFIEALNNWYIRRSRDRFWKSEQDADKRAAYDTLYTVLVTHDAGDGAVPALPHRARSTARWWTARACISRTGRTPRPSRSTRRWSSAWTLPAPPARRRPRSARRRTSATACRSGRSPSRIRSMRLLEPLRDVIAEEANVKEVVFADDPAAFGSRGAVGQSAHPRQASRRRR